MRLSGGERQRISLARAFLHDGRILVLDEPTSSVDVHTEARILAAMERLMEGRTSFLIAHRASTLQNCGFSLELRTAGWWPAAQRRARWPPSTSGSAATVDIRCADLAASVHGRLVRRRISGVMSDYSSLPSKCSHVPFRSAAPEAAMVRRKAAGLAMSFGIDAVRIQAG